MKAVFNNPYFKLALLLPCLVYVVFSERKYYLTHGEFSAGTILIWSTFAVMAGASLIYWLVSVIRQKMGKHQHPRPEPPM